MPRLFQVFVISATMLSSLTAAERVPVFLELFTSEGCSSCPPADVLLSELDRQQPIPGADLIVASEHVDYWNRLGWTDPFSSPQFTKRQQDYAAKLGVNDVYTPQLVIDGKAELVGSLKREVITAIERVVRTPKIPLSVSAKRAGDEAEIHLTAESHAGARKSNLFVALARNAVTSYVSRGENSGRKLPHVAIVQTIRQVGTWDTQEALDRNIRVKLAGNAKDGETRVIAFAQDPSTGRILAVAQSKL